MPMPAVRACSNPAFALTRTLYDADGRHSVLGERVGGIERFDVQFLKQSSTFGVFRRPPRAAKAPRMPDCFIALHPEAAALVRQAQRLARHRPAAGCQAAAVFGVVTVAGDAPLR